MIRKIAKDNISLVLQSVVSVSIPIFLLPHIAGVIGLEEYGKIAVVWVWAGYGAIVVQYSFQLTGPVWLMRTEDNMSNNIILTNIMLAKSLLLVCIILIVGVFVSKEFLITGSLAPEYILLLALPLSSCMNSIWFLQAKDRFGSVFKITIIGTILTLICGFFFVTSGNEYAIPMSKLTFIIPNLTIGFGTFYLAKSLVGKFNPNWNMPTVINYLNNGRNLFISQFISSIYTLSGPLVVAFLIDSKAAGLYSITERFINAVTSAALLTYTAAYPKLAYLFNTDRIKYWAIIKLIIFLYIFITFTASFLAWYMRDYLVVYLYGNQSEQGTKILLSALVLMIVSIFGPVLTGYLTISNRSEDVLPLNFKVLLISFLLGAPSVIIYGCHGWFLSLAASQLYVIWTCYMYWSKKNELE